MYGIWRNRRVKMINPFYDPEAVIQDADIEQAELEAAGRAYSRRLRRARILFNQGRIGEASVMCPHGGGYPLKSPAAKNSEDPREGEEGVRCCDCGSVLSHFEYQSDAPIRIIHMCETGLHFGFRKE